MRNEIDEEFRVIQNEIKSTLVELLTSIVESNNQKASKVIKDSIINKQLKGKISRVNIEEILNAMYADDPEKRDDIMEEIDILNQQQADKGLVK